MNVIKKLFKKIIWGNKCDQETYIRYLRSEGATIGEDVNLFSIDECHIDTLNAHLLTIGDHVNIVSSTILTHDYSWSVIKGKYGEILGNQRPVKLGNNIFIGTGSLILGGTIIEDNVIIGAHSVVTGICESDSVYAGNPAKRLMSLEEYREKRTQKQFEEAKVFVQMWTKAHGVEPDEEKLHEYFYLFKSADNLNSVFERKLRLCGNYEESLAYMKEHKPVFENYKEFLDACH